MNRDDLVPPIVAELLPANNPRCLPFGSGDLFQKMKNLTDEIPGLAAAIEKEQYARQSLTAAGGQLLGAIVEAEKLTAG